MDTIRIRRPALPLVAALLVASVAAASTVLGAAHAAKPPFGGKRRHLPDVITMKGWSKAPIAPEALAARVDSRLSTLKNAVASSLGSIDVPSGFGTVVARCVIESPSRFHVEVMRLVGKSHGELRKTTFDFRNGSLRALLDQGWMERPVAQYGHPDPRLLATFSTSFDDALFRGVRGARPLSNLVAQARKAGYQVAAERNSLAVPQLYRLRLVAPGGKRRISVDIEQKRMLVTQIATEDRIANKPPQRILWSCAWAVKGSPLTPDEILYFDPARQDYRVPGAPPKPGK